MSDMEGHEEPAEGLMQSQHQLQEEEDNDDDDDDEDIIIDDESLDEFLQEENQWNTMYHRLRQWGQEHGHCNPRRNWKAKIDAEEKSLGNWAGKQRQEARSEQGIDPYKRAALNRLNFAFDVRINNFEEFRKKLDAYLEKQEDGKLPRLDSSYLALQGEGIGRMLHYYYSEPKIMLGILKARTTRHLEGKASTYFTQERIDMLTNAGLEWYVLFLCVIILNDTLFLLDFIIIWQLMIDG